MENMQNKQTEMIGLERKDAIPKQLEGSPVRAQY